MVNNDELLFQIIDINSDDIATGSDYWDKEFILTFYGKTVHNQDVVCNVSGFKPYFFLRVPNNCGNSSTSKFLKIIFNLIQEKKPGF